MRGAVKQGKQQRLTLHPQQMDIIYGERCRRRRLCTARAPSGRGVTRRASTRSRRSSHRAQQVALTRARGRPQIHTALGSGAVEPPAQPREQFSVATRREIVECRRRRQRELE